MEQQPESSEFEEISLVHKNHDEAYMYISQGLSYDEQGQYILANEMYAKGINKIEKALEVRCDKSYCIGTKWDKVRQMQHKMRRTLLEVRSRLSKPDSVPSVPPRPHHDLDRPPSYEEACGNQSPVTSNSMQFAGAYEKDTNGNDDCVKKNKDLLQDEAAAAAQANGQSMGAEELFCIPDGAQIFFVSPDGFVSAPSYPSSLHIYKFVDSSMAAVRNSPQAWLQVGNWIYPLDPGRSPVLHSGFGAYMFPDVAKDLVGAAVGLILPSDVDQSVLDVFEALMIELTAIKAEKPIWPKGEEVEESLENRRMSRRISEGIITGAEMLSQGLNKGAELTGELMKKGAAMIRERVSPVDRPFPVDPKIKQGVAVAKNVSGTVLTVSGYVVSRLGKLTVALGQHLAPHIRKQGEKAFQAMFQTDTVDSKRKMDDVMIVAAGGLAGFSTVYMGLENAARTLATCLATETVQTVNHTYGQDVSAVVDNTLNTIGNVALATHNVRALGVKGVAKRTAKDTGRALLTDYIQSEHHASTSRNGSNAVGNGNGKREENLSNGKK